MTRDDEGVCEGGYDAITTMPSLEEHMIATLILMLEPQ
jgi:hypothetical protein